MNSEKVERGKEKKESKNIFKTFQKQRKGIKGNIEIKNIETKTYDRKEEIKKRKYQQRKKRKRK